MDSLSSGQKIWILQPDYPFSSRISAYATVSTDSAVFVIGGWVKDSVDGKKDLEGEYIAEFKAGTWTL